MTYRIRVTFDNGAAEAFVASFKRTTWDGSWFTRREAVQTWNTRAGAERWLAERPLINGTVEEIDNNDLDALPGVAWRREVRA
jgi:hypothetical protein